MKKKPTRKARAGMPAKPAEREGLRLRDEALAAVEKLAACARTGNELAGHWLANLEGTVSSRLFDMLRDAPNEPFYSWLAGELVRNLEGSVRALNMLADKRPEHFREAAGRMERCPMLRERGSKAGKRDPFPALPTRIGLGADLLTRGDRTIDFESLPNRITATRLNFVEGIRRTAKKHPKARWVPPIPALRQWMDLPLLSDKPEVVCAWWEKAIEPLLENDRHCLLSGLLKSERDRQRQRGRTDAATWAYFKKACRDALQSLAPRTGLARNSPYAQP